MENPRTEIVKHDGAKYVRINPDDIDISNMTLVRKVTDVVAAQVKKGTVKVVTRHGKQVETINYAKTGDWLVYDIGASDFKGMLDKLLNCEKSVITKENFYYLYQVSDEMITLGSEAQIKLIGDLLADNFESAEFDGSFVNDLKRYKYIGKPVYAGYVPFNFVLRAPWGEDQFLKRGGLVIYDSNYERHRSHKVFETEAGRKDFQKEREGLFYAIEGAKSRVPGIFEKTYSIAPGTTGTIIADTFKMAIMADRSPIAGIQFNNRDLAKAYDMAGKNLPDFLKKFLE